MSPFLVTFCDPNCFARRDPASEAIGLRPLRPSRWPEVRWVSSRRNRMDIKPVQHTPKNIAAYETALQIEQERYKDVSDVHDLPAIFHYWSHTYVLPMVLECGGTSTDHINAIYAKYLKLS